MNKMELKFVEEDHDDDFKQKLVFKSLFVYDEATGEDFKFSIEITDWDGSYTIDYYGSELAEVHPYADKLVVEKNFEGIIMELTNSHTKKIYRRTTYHDSCILWYEFESINPPDEYNSLV